MASVGLPILADDVYGGKHSAGLQRQALHAFRLGFAHPVTQADLDFYAPVPLDFGNAMAELGLRYNEGSTKNPVSARKSLQKGAV
jgi:23S rRNA pseudouridine1911/1915/1917 synthase